MNIAPQVIRSRLLYEAGARSRRTHITALGRLYRLSIALSDIERTMAKPGSRPLSSEGMRKRADRIQGYKVSINIIRNQDV